MKNLFFAFMLVFAANILVAKQLNVAIFYNQYLNVNGQTYIETYFSLDPRSVVLAKNENNMWQGGIEILIVIEKEGQTVAYDKLQLNATESADTTILLPYTVQQSRIKLEAGTYTMKIELNDMATPKEPILLEQVIEINLDRSKLTTSSILLLDSYKESDAQSVVGKWGYDLVPIVPTGTYYIGENISSLPFYCEVFNSDTTFGDNEPFMVKYYLKDNLKNAILPRYAGFQRVSGAVVNPILNSFNIKNLPSGYFDLVVEVVSQSNEVLSTETVSFYRRNTEADMQNFNANDVLIANSFVEHIKNVDSMYFYIDCLYPISNDGERRVATNVLAERNLEQMQRYFLVFWNRRNQLEPERDWELYLTMVKYAQKQFGTYTVPGYRTDMGRVLLQYGKPTLIETNNQDPSNYPYQIWQYDVLVSESTPTQNNQIFVFVDQSGVGRNYTLIHSAAIGEVHDSKWEYALNKTLNRGGDVDATSQQQSRDNFGYRVHNNFIIGDQRFWGQQ